MKIAVIGSGISGLAAARELAPRCEVTLFEQTSQVGGHVYTVPVCRETGKAALQFDTGSQCDHVDMGFIVCNRENYPFFFAMLKELGVATRTTSMSFSVNLPDAGLEWSSRSASGVFAQRRRLLSFAHWRLMLYVMRFLHQAKMDMSQSWLATVTLDEYLAKRNVSNEVRQGFVVPLAAALWSLAPARCGEFPAQTYVRFLSQHGMLDPIRPLGWETIIGGSQVYVQALRQKLPITWRLNTPVTAIDRVPGAVIVSAAGMQQRFDRVVIATHADMALHLLGDPSSEERKVLGAFQYSHNQTALHRDMSFMPKAQAAHASWNYLAANDSKDVTVTYSMNHLQGLATKRPYLVTLNPHRPIASADLIHETAFRHPQFTQAALAAQISLAELSNSAEQDRRTHFAGAYAGFGFHEDGMRSGVMAARSALRLGAR
jgi:uncharacterized protein